MAIVSERNSQISEVGREASQQASEKVVSNTSIIQQRRIVW